MNVVLLGKPGCGKGTQAEMIIEPLGLTHLSTGNIFREHLAQGTELGNRIRSIMDDGELVDDTTTCQVVADFLGQHQGQYILFDGFPRTVPQADWLDSEDGIPLDLIILMDLPDEEVIRRLTSRRQCRQCGKIYNVLFFPPQKEGVCDVCGGEVYQRDDDSEEVARERLEEFYEETAPLIDYYRNQGRLTPVDASGSREETNAKIVSLLEEIK
ncbi:MAG: adenylate kinase [Patescibacteria group bacterium]